MLDDLQVFRGLDYKLNDKISIHHPKLGEICDYGEQKYFSMVTSLTATPSVYKVWLTDNNIDYENVSDFELFCFICQNLKPYDTAILLGDLDLSSLKLMLNEKTGHNILIDVSTGLIIDDAVHTLMADYIRKIHGFEKKEDFCGNAHAKQYIIDKERRMLARLQNQKQTSILVPLISALTNCEQFKYNHDTVWDVAINVFMDSIKRIQLNLSFKFYMQGAYSGMVKLEGNIPDWLGVIKK